MASIERTGFGRLVSARELADLTPTAVDVVWATERSRCDEHRLALVLSLRCFARLGYFLRSEDVLRYDVTSALFERVGRASRHLTRAWTYPSSSSVGRPRRTWPMSTPGRQSVASPGA